MKKIFAVILILTSTLLAQMSPESYLLNKPSLQKFNDSSPKSNSILDILAVGDTIWLGTSRGLSKSNDGGATWTNYYQTSEFGTASITALAYGNGIIWAALGTSVEINGSSLPKGLGLRYSSDNGVTWNSIPQPVDAEDDTVVTYGINQIRALPVTTEINNITYDISVKNNTVFIASFAGGLRKSDDLGQTWQRVVLPPDYLDEIKPTDSLNFSLQPVSGAFGNENNLNHRLFAVIAGKDNEVWAGTAGGVNKSTDGGVSWQKFNHANQRNPISGNFITALGYDTAKDIIYASTWKAEGIDEYYGVSATSNGGVTWEVSLTGERPHNFGFINYSNVNDALCATDNGIFRTSDNGLTWNLPPLIIDSENNQPIETNVFYSATSVNKGSSADIWIGSDNGLAKLTETGAAWQGDWKIFHAAGESSNFENTFAFPNPFAPGLENIKIKYLLQNNADVSIRIFNFSMQLVKTLLQNAPRTGGIEQIENWDGRDEEGKLVPNGVYFYRIDVNGSKGIYGKIMAVR